MLVGFMASLHADQTVRDLTQPSQSVRDVAQPLHGSLSFAQVLNRLANELDRGERTVNSAMRVGLDSSDDLGMIALQAGVYRYVEAVDLCTKLVDRTTNAVKTILQAQ